MKRGSVLAVTASLALALGACGGTGTDEYESEVEAPLSDADEAVSGLDDISSSSQYSDDLDAFESAEDSLTELVDALEGTTAPSEVEPEAEELIGASEELAEQSAEGAEAAEEETTDGYPEGYPEEFEAVEEFEDARDQFEEALSGS